MKKKKHPFLLGKLLIFQYFFVPAYHVAQKEDGKNCIVKKFVKNWVRFCNKSML